MQMLIENIRNWLLGNEIVFFHEFVKGPYGGSNTFMNALFEEYKKNGISVGKNRVSRRTKAVLLNAFLFNVRKLRAYKKHFPGLRIIHRVDGPVGIYRGDNSGIDQELLNLNLEFAGATVFQSNYSYKKNLELGLKFINPSIITNAVDSRYFYKLEDKYLNKKVKIIATSWSDNPKKGGATYKWIEENLDWNKYEFTFVGRSQIEFKKIRHIQPVASEELGNILRDHDIYITASEDDPCSNALIEALSCGLPAVFLESGGHPELVNKGGVGFKTKEKSLGAIEEIVLNYDKYQKNIKVADMKEVGGKYLKILLDQ